MWSMQTTRSSETKSIRFRAMGSDAHVVVVGGPSGLAERARDRVDDLERRWSRFRPDSEVTALNGGAGTFVAVSPETRLLVERAVDAWRLTGGTFDPTVLGAVVRAGYGRSFELGPIRAHGPSPLLAGCTDITIDGGRVRLPAATAFDPGGIGKGLAADVVVGETMAAGAAGVCVNLGGDLRVAGEGPDGAPWTIAVEHPWAAEPLGLLGLNAGAVATSTPLLRAWTIGGRHVHHLIDPATGEPSESDLTLATVVAGDAWMAEALAKTVLLRGADRAFDVLDITCDALIVDRCGRVSATNGLSAFLGGRRLPASIGVPAMAEVGP
jgi:thiamine biosynthesis lipoprotein